MRGWWLVFGAGLAACGGRSVPVSEPVAVSVGMSARPAPEPVAPGPASPPAEVTPWQPTESQEQLYRLLSVRDPEPSCSVAAEASATPALDLLALVDHAAQPPWVGMRAAGCLLSNHLDEVQEHVIGWMRTESTYGLALLTTRQLDALPEDVATAVVSAGLGGPADAEVRERAAQDGRASVRALVED